MGVSALRGMQVTNVIEEFDLIIENYLNIDKSFEKVKYSIKTQLRKVATEKYRNKFKEKLSSYSDFLFV
jgi:hypothetical protein